MKTIAVQTIALGFVIFLVSLPLVYRRIPMNVFYGIRIPAAFKSEQRWYDINSYEGRLLAKWSLLIVVSGAVGLILPSTAYPGYRCAIFCVLLVSVVAPLIRVFIWAGRSERV